MRNLVLEWCADVFGVTTHSRLGQLLVASFVLFAFGLLLFLRWGPVGWVPSALLLTTIALVAQRVSAARSALWRAACLGLEDPTQRPAPVIVGPPTALSLQRLAHAVDAVRRARYVDAHDLLPQIDRTLLRPEEAQLHEAARAMVSLGLGSTQRAAQQAVTALPTGSEDLDTHLGRVVVADAWNLPERLAAIASAWERSGIDAAESGSLPRLYRLMRLRIDAGSMHALPAGDARDLSSEARAIGDEDLAAELEARARGTAYR